MKWFRLIFKKTDSISRGLERLADYLPEYYKQDIQFQYFKEFMDNHEWNLATESLAELAIASRHYFSQDYWKQLADIFAKINNQELTSFCLKQIRKTSQAIPFKIPFGQTVEKVSDTLYNRYIAEFVKDKWVRERHKRDNVKGLCDSDGIYFKPNGRSGYLYIVKKGHVAEVYLEMEINGWGIYFPEKLFWIYPYEPSQSDIDLENIKEEIRQWADRVNFSISF